MSCKTCKFFYPRKETLTPSGRIGLNTIGDCWKQIDAQVIKNIKQSNHLPFWMDIKGYRQVYPESGDGCFGFEKK